MHSPESADAGKPSRRTNGSAMLLTEEYAAEPEPETKALYRRLLTGGKPIPATIPAQPAWSRPPASSAADACSPS